MSRVKVAWSGRCHVCDWTTTGDVRRVDLDTERHTKTQRHATTQEGVPA